MTRSSRTPPGHVYHVLNRANRRATLFKTEQDYLAFMKVVEEAFILTPIRIVDFCVMPNHWHFVLWPELEGQLAEFMHYLTTTHAVRWNLFRELYGTGHVYQGPYKAFPVEEDEHCLCVCRYVVRNALRANLVLRAEAWPWSSLHARVNSTRSESLLSTELPLVYPPNWVDFVNQPLTEAELAAIRRSVRFCYPFGGEDWTNRTAPMFGFTNPPGQRGRPRRAR